MRFWRCECFPDAGSDTKPVIFWVKALTVDDAWHSATGVACRMSRSGTFILDLKPED